MKYNELGQSGLKVSELSMGGTTATGRYGSEAGHQEFREALERAIALGINLIDTAEGYGEGESEQIIGEVLKPVRDRVMIATKVSFKNLRRGDVARACEGSLRRLATDYIDVYFIHRPNPEVPVEETMEALLELRQRGLIKAIGLSNFTRTDMEKASAVGRFDVIQPCYNLLWRNIEKEIVPYCVEHQISIVPYSPLVQGILTGKFDRDLSLEGIDNRSRILLFQKEWYGKCLDVVDGMRPIARRHGKSLAQVAINWVRMQRSVSSVIIGGKSPRQVDENVGATGWDLSREDLATLDRLSRAVTDRLPDQPSFWFKS
jgi:myo-inositol catabolism protein IolS